MLREGLICSGEAIKMTSERRPMTSNADVVRRLLEKAGGKLRARVKEIKHD